MENFKAIEFHRTRDFSQKMNATFEFIRQNFKGLGKGLLFIAGPPVTVASFLMGSFMTDLQNVAAMMRQTDTFMKSFTTPAFWLQILLAMIFLVVASVMTIGTINNYIVLYDEKKTNRIEFSELWERVRDTFWMYFGTMFFFFLLTIALYLVLVVPVVVLAMVSPGLMVLSVFLVLGVAFYVMISGALTFIVRGYEKKSFLEAIGRSFMLVRGKWWSTFGLIVVLSIIAGIISYVFAIPYYIVMFVNTMHSVSSSTLEEPSSGMHMLSVILFAFYYMAQMLLQSLTHVGIAFQYFNLVERKEAPGLLGHIENLGNEGPGSVASPEEQY